MKSRVCTSRTLHGEKSSKTGNVICNSIQLGVCEYTLMYILLRSPLKTKKMRNAEEQERMKKYPKATIRVRFPDRLLLQAVFQSKETGNCLKIFVEKNDARVRIEY